MSDFLNSVPADNEPSVELPTNDVSPIIAGLSNNNVITISPCDENGEPIGNQVVKAIFIDADKDFGSNWQTPFDSSNPENKLPMITAALQSGELIENHSLA